MAFLAEQGAAAASALSHATTNKAVLKAAGTKWAIYKLPSAQLFLPSQQWQLSQQPQIAPHGPARLPEQATRADSAQGTTATEPYQHLSDFSQPGQEAASRPAFTAKPSRFAAGKTAVMHTTAQPQHVQSADAAVDSAATAKHGELPVVCDVASDAAVKKSSGQAGAAQQQQPDADAGDVAMAVQDNASHDVVGTQNTRPAATRQKKAAFACKGKVFKQPKRPKPNARVKAKLKDCFGSDSQSEGAQSEAEPDELQAAAATARPSAAGASEPEAADTVVEKTAAAPATSSAVATGPVVQAASAMPSHTSASPASGVIEAAVEISAKHTPQSASPGKGILDEHAIHSSKRLDAADAAVPNSTAWRADVAPHTKLFPTPEAATAPAQAATAPAQATDTAVKVDDQSQAALQSTDVPPVPKVDDAKVLPFKVKTAKKAQLGRPTLQATATKMRSPSPNASAARSNSKHVSYCLLPQLGYIHLLACDAIHHRLLLPICIQPYCPFACTNPA